jgi:glyoxylase I family protein
MSAATGGEAFDLRRTGFDHTRSTSTGGPTLTSGWHGSSNSGLIHSPIADREYGAVLTSKDPDNIPFEMSFEADHP